MLMEPEMLRLSSDPGAESPARRVECALPTAPPLSCDAPLESKSSRVPLAGLIFAALLLAVVSYRGYSLRSSSHPALVRNPAEFSAPMDLQLAALQREVRAELQAVRDEIRAKLEVELKKAETVLAQTVVKRTELEDAIRELKIGKQEENAQINTDMSTLNSLVADVAAARERIELLDARQSEWEVRAPNEDPQDTKQLREELDALYRDVHMDGAGKVDWAQSTMGATVVPELTSAGYNRNRWNIIGLRFLSNLPIHWFGRYRGLAEPISPPPEVVLRGGGSLRPGECFSFEGPANITVLLPQPVMISELGLQHVVPQLTPNESSAVRRFRAFGLPTSFSRDLNKKLEAGIDDFEGGGTILAVEEQRPYVLLGEWTFDFPEKHLQLFTVGEELPAMSRVLFEFLDNHGGPYSCVYRVRVHGDGTGE